MVVLIISARRLNQKGRNALEPSQHFPIYPIHLVKFSYDTNNGIERLQLIYLSLYVCDLISWLSFVGSNCEFVTF